MGKCGAHDDTYYAYCSDHKIAPAKLPTRLRRAGLEAVVLIYKIEEMMPSRWGRSSSAEPDKVEGILFCGSEHSQSLTRRRQTARRPDSAITSLTTLQDDEILCVEIAEKSDMLNKLLKDRLMFRSLTIVGTIWCGYLAGYCCPLGAHSPVSSASPLPKVLAPT